ncbi:uncharacterized protein LOC134179083 [Corticium candelabrum]|uniref:uncharacterized protein LOC134179083 n=1 Tax=Corticium candelabrum TaxID=121492 RepID=UPI002E2676C4|nr:uncharacterized protein LOC134179083 [Corticium candelabrum]
MRGLSTAVGLLLFAHTFAERSRRCYACVARSPVGPEELICSPDAPSSSLSVINCTSNCSLTDTRIFGRLFQRHMDCDTDCREGRLVVDVHHEDVTSCCTDDLCNRPDSPATATATGSTALATSMATTENKASSNGTVTLTVSTDENSTRVETGTGSYVVLRPSVLVLVLVSGCSLWH